MNGLTNISNDVLISIIGIGVIFLFIIVLLLIRLSKSEKRRKDSDNKFHQLESKVNKLELQTLESKLNPHLFKNILNSIQSHAYQTYFALDKLANVLDYILYESRNKFVTPKEEIDTAKGRGNCALYLPDPARQADSLWPV